MKIGLPRALVYYYYYPMWVRLFELLGIETVVSDLTTKSLIEKGIKVTVPEICVPIKIFNAHVINLMEKNVDYVFVPRFVSVEGGRWFCPKFLGLPELVKYTLPDYANKILSMDLKYLGECNYKNYSALVKLLAIKPQLLKKALSEANRYWERFRDLSKLGLTIEEAELCAKNPGSEKDFLKTATNSVTLGVMGYVYNIYDPFINMDIIKKLREMDVRVITFEMVEGSKKHTRNFYWTFTQKIYNSSTELLEDDNIDGLVHVTAFGCGPDSILGKFLELDSEQHKKPFMTIRVDEHTGENHLQTRIEAFVDMIKRNKYKKRGLC